MSFFLVTLNILLLIHNVGESLFKNLMDILKQLWKSEGNIDLEVKKKQMI